MSVARKRGTQFETDVVNFLRDNGHPHVERRAGNGHHDRGDIAGIPSTVIECKALKTIDLAGAMDEAVIEAVNAGAELPVAIIKRRGSQTGNAYVVMRLADWARWIAT